MPTKIINGKKNCSKCKEIKELLDFRVHIQHSTGYRSQCRKCEQVRPKNNHIRKKTKSFTTNSSYKLDILEKYGKECFCCRENNKTLLCVDHINDNGKEHGTANCRYKGIALYRYLIKNNYPDGIQIACFNCNIGRRINGGLCPHKGEKAII